MPRTRPIEIDPTLEEIAERTAAIRAEHAERARQGRRSRKRPYRLGKRRFGACRRPRAS